VHLLPFGEQVRQHDGVVDKEPTAVLANVTERSTAPVLASSAPHVIPRLAPVATDGDPSDGSTVTSRSHPGLRDGHVIVGHIDVEAGADRSPSHRCDDIEVRPIVPVRPVPDVIEIVGSVKV